MNSCGKSYPFARGRKAQNARGNAAGASCACGGGCRCGGGAKNPPKKTLRRLVVWAVVLLALIAAVRLWNRASQGDADVPAQPADARNPAPRC